MRWRQRVWLSPLAVLSLGWALFSFVVVFVRWAPAARLADDYCGGGYGNFCGGVIGFVLPVLGVAFGSMGFLLWRYTRVRRWYQKLARTSPQSLVPTAGGIVGDVVGRDQLCDVLIGDLRDPVSRRPHVLVGGVGTGKTAVLVKLASRLASKNVVPVTIRLRDAQDSLDFESMAKSALARWLNSRLGSEGEMDRIWRQLRRDNRVVVLADGLEEVLPDREDRDTVIRLAIHKAVAEQLPLIITSRPHNPLRNMEAFLIELEPLGEGPALEYATRGLDGTSQPDPARDRQRMSSLLQAVDVVHAPLYLQVIRNLDSTHLASILDNGAAVNGVNGGDPNLHQLDRVGLRWQLLDAWCEALVAGRLQEDHVLDPKCRQGVIEVLSALACIGVKQDRLQVRFDALSGRSSGSSGGASGRPPHQRVWDELEKRLSSGPNRQIGHPEFADPDEGLPLAATMGMELGIVSAHRDGVRFKHSVVEAFLAARFMGAALADRKYIDEAFGKAGREFLMALEFCFHTGTHGNSHVLGNFASGVGLPDSSWPALRGCLVGKADKFYEKDRSKYLQLYATIFEIDGGRQDAALGLLLGELNKKWPEIRTGTVTFDRAIEEAKIQVVNRCGEALRGAEHRKPPRSTVATAAPGHPRSARRPERRGVDLVPRVGGMVRRIAASQRQPGAGSQVTETVRRPDRASGDGGAVVGGFRPDRIAAFNGATRQYDGLTADNAYRLFYKLLCSEKMYPVRLAGAQQIGAGGLRAAVALTEDLMPVSGQPATRAASNEGRDGRDRVVTEQIIQAWIAPMLYRSCQAESARSREGQSDAGTALDIAIEFLDLKLKRLVEMDPTKPETRPSLTQELALAQGFRFAANARDSTPSAQNHAQLLLIDKAERALMHSRYWYSQLVLLEALTLLSLPTDPDQPLPDRGHGSDPRRQVRHWLSIAGSRCAGVQTSTAERPHPFVKAAGELCVLALATRSPAEYLWIDESGMASRVGSYSRQRASQYSQRSWILESAGWGSLHPLAQRLLGDVLVLLNLSERGGSLSTMDERLAKADRWDIPPCVVNDRSPLEPCRTVGSSEARRPPGDTCLDGCRFNLCPYPPKGEPFYRSELGESFCSRQITLLGKWYSPWGGAGWQKATRKNLRRFWLDMSDRVRPESADLPTPVHTGRRWA